MPRVEDDGVSGVFVKHHRRNDTMRAANVALIIGLYSHVCLAGSGGWIEYADETATRLIAAPDRGVSDPAE